MQKIVRMRKKIASGCPLFQARTGCVFPVVNALPLVVFYLLIVNALPLVVFYLLIVNALPLVVFYLLIVNIVTYTMNLKSISI